MTAQSGASDGTLTGADALREEARAAALYVVHLKRELELTRIELAAAKSQVESLEATLLATQSELATLREAEATPSRWRARRRP